MVYGYRYIDVDETGRVTGSRTVPLKTSIDTEGMVIPEQPTDAIYALYYNDTEGLHYVKVADFEEETAQPTQLDRIEENVNKLVTETTVTDVLLGVE